MPKLRFNKLQGEVPGNLTSGSHTPVIWTCDCGKQVTRPYKEVYKGRSKSCGRCDWFSAKEMETRKFNSLRMKDPIEAAPCSNKKFSWVCDCGKETMAAMQDVFKGHTKSCGKCGLYGRTVEITSEEMTTRKFGHLRIKTPSTITPGSHQRAIWVCDCGKEKSIDINSVMRGLSKSCGHCDDIPAAEMTTRKFGHLKLRIPMDTPPGSGKKTVWICDCGNETTAMIAHVTSGHTASCGRCLLSMRINYGISKHDIRSLRTPITPEQLPTWCPIALETITRVSTPFRAQCRLCGKEYKPRWDSIRVGLSLTCGCTTSRVSSGQREIYDFITKIGIEAKLEHSLGNMKFDIFVPSHDLTIEYTGLRWHSYPDSKRRDIAKQKTAMLNGMRHLMIFEDEWVFGRSKVENLLRSILKTGQVTALRPSQCQIRIIDHSVADPFYEEFHYIGGCNTKINYGVFLGDKLIACCSFKRPTRQSKYDWELVRMASDSQFRVHGIWSKILKQFVSESDPTSVVSFSDNRLFTGQTYEKMGFTFDGDVQLDYYWWKNKRRYHKSAMRKPKGEIRTETELRQAQGFAKIWDLGKKRWVYRT